MKVIYSTQRSSFKPGYDYRNPKFFQAPVTKDVSEVTVIGDYPRVVEAYTALGFNVKQLGHRADNYVPPLPEGLLAVTGSDVNSTSVSEPVQPSDEDREEHEDDEHDGDQPADLTSNQETKTEEVIEDDKPERQLHELRRHELVELLKKKRPDLKIAPIWGTAKLIKLLQGNG